MLGLFLLGLAVSEGSAMPGENLRRLFEALAEGPLPVDVAKAKRRDAAERWVSPAFSGGGPISSGQSAVLITGPSGLVDGKQTHELGHAYAHDMGVMIRCCLAEIAKHRATGSGLAPFYFLRVAILLRKAERYSDEVRLIEGFLRFDREKTPGGSFEKLRQRLPKALKLARMPS